MLIFSSTSTYDPVWDFRLGPPNTQLQVLGFRKGTFDINIVTKRNVGKKATDILDVYTLSKSIHTIGSKDGTGVLSGAGVEHVELTVNGRCFCAVFHRYIFVYILLSNLQNCIKKYIFGSILGYYMLNLDTKEILNCKYALSGEINRGDHFNLTVII